MGANTYTIASISGTVITTVEALTQTYLPGTSFFRGLVSQLDDKAGLAENAIQATAADMPLWVDTAPNDRATLFFDGGGDRLASASTIDLTATSAVTNVSIFNYQGTPPVGGDYAIGEFSTNFNAVNNGFIEAIANNDGGFFGYWAGMVGNGGLNDEGQTALNSGQWHIANTVHDKTQPATDEVAILINNDNSTINHTFGGNNNNNAFGNYGYYLGARANGTLPMLGNIGEKALYANALTADERELVDRYFSAKWDQPLAPDMQVADTPGIFSQGYAISRFEREDTLVGDLTEELGDVPFHYTLTGGNGAGIFSIESATGKIRINNPDALAKTTQQSFTLNVQADLDGIEPLRLDVNITVVGDFNFQIGESSSDVLRTNMGSLALVEILGEEPLTLTTEEGARAAFDAVSDGIDFITGRRAYIGGKQRQAEIISEATASALQSQDAARAVIADTDIVAASTEFASLQVRNSMSIAVAAQAQQLRSEALLGLLNGETA